MRYLICYVHPRTGRERPGTGPEAGSFAEYANVNNVIKFQLAHDHYPAGQYHIYTWPRGGNCSEKFVTAYKLVQKCSVCGQKPHMVGCPNMDKEF